MNLDLEFGHVDFLVVYYRPRKHVRSGQIQKLKSHLDVSLGARHSVKDVSEHRGGLKITFSSPVNREELMTVIKAINSF